MPRNLDARHAELAAKAVDGTITQTELDEAQALVDEAAEDANYTFHRYSRNPNGVSGAAYLMFAADQSEVERGYGPYHFVASDANAVDVETLRDEIVEALEEHADEYESENADAIGDELNPSQIVVSAEAWDNQEVVRVAWEYVLEPRGITKVKTRDGLIVFDERSIKSADPFTFDDDGNLIPLSERFQADSPDIRHNPPDLDTRHAELAAKAVAETITKAELREAQALVDEAAKAAGYNVGPVWHYSPVAGIRSFQPLYRELADGTKTEAEVAAWLKHLRSGAPVGYMDFRSGTFFTPQRGSYQGYGSTEYSVYLKLDNPGIKVHGGRVRITVPGMPIDALMLDMEDDGIIREIAVIDPMKIKSADPFTFNDDGSLIPLSERFQTDSPDIRHNPPYDRERYSEPYSLLEPEHAEQIALELQEEDPDWSYQVRHDPKGTGLSFIEIFDEEGKFVGRWK